MYSADYNKMSPAWRMIRTLLAGTDAMRNAAEDYLPMYRHEHVDTYQLRVNNAVLFNKYEETVEMLTSKPFTKPVDVSEDCPEQVSNLFDDIDLKGNKLEVFLRQWFQEGLAMGSAFVLVDSPALDKTNGRTLADDIKENIRPYWVLIPADNMFGLYVAKVRGEWVVTECRYVERSVVPNGIGEDILEQVIVIKQGTTEYYKKKESKSARGFARFKKSTSAETEWEIDRTAANDYVDGIPLVRFYTNKPQSPQNVKPPLLDLAYLNVRHFQSYADQINILSVSRFPMLAATGVDTDTPNSVLVVGPNRNLVSGDADAKYYYVEASCTSIEAGRKDLTDLEDQMSKYGTSMLTQQMQYQTATGRNLDTTQFMNKIQAMTVDFEDAVAYAMYYTAKWFNKAAKAGGRIKLYIEEPATGYESAELASVEKARDRGDISRETYIGVLQRKNILPETLDLDEELVKVKAEMADGLFSETMLKTTPKRVVDNSVVIQTSDSTPKVT